MSEIFVNLKRFEVPRSLGGVCPTSDPEAWVEHVMDECAAMGLGKLGSKIVFFLPEALIIPGVKRLMGNGVFGSEGIEVGCQGVFRENIVPGGNFGAFTTNLPAVAARNLGCTWSIIGHSEERKDKLGILRRFMPEVESSNELRTKANQVVNELIGDEVARALEAGLNVLLCVGETAEERRGGTFEEQQPRIEAVLEAQLLSGLREGMGTGAGRRVVIGYEPVWAIGPGKTPPGWDYISYVSELIKSICNDKLGAEFPVVYGGGLKKENAGMIASIPSISGGLVALTRFTGQIGFEPLGLKEIIEEYHRGLPDGQDK